MSLTPPYQIIEDVCVFGYSGSATLVPPNGLTRSFVSKTWHKPTRRLHLRAALVNLSHTLRPTPSASPRKQAADAAHHTASTTDLLNIVPPLGHPGRFRSHTISIRSCRMVYFALLTNFPAILPLCVMTPSSSYRMPTSRTRGMRRLAGYVLFSRKFSCVWPTRIQTGAWVFRRHFGCIFGGQQLLADTAHTIPLPWG